ncbi:MAG TPA: NAD-dependent succinate-semialdehyde dehydrogenase [Spirochaetota bacterium]|nr:NAD-dependent succinate-semialdehyde dehydrogenase [Spirochaetota bacterium]HOD13586.1 NAD-dependent succinate-semialdehyde dehydrogenase [Spirochaetota bacterium]HPG49730.1 NAD-dependent succinate-semialdehyde dehydrogenase [Spirochaetota bacterium]HPN10426.1 NAD-dependent succinate-semialdehyde dehydrogenase [Spirochaetota bacterium]HQL80814.1 NAD-dependent succinate-semialdehyde dehydrogenase [Spirochaetota bacterium]
MEQYPLYIDGKWVTSDKKIRVVNPATDDPFAEVSTTDRAGVKQALESAQDAFAQWSGMTGMRRGDYLLSIVALLTARSEEIARTITRENGKPIAQSKAEVSMTIDHFRWFAEEARRGYGRVVPHQADGKRNFVIRQAVGVVGAISPWNFPLVLAARKVAPALAAGCTVVLKPASQTPVCAVELARCIDDAKLPAGVFHLVAGNASEIGAELLENPICRKISFTGSTEVGKQLIRGAASTCTRLSLELGGNAPLLVFADADLSTAVEGALTTKFRNTGQSCIASNRIYVERPIYDAFLASFTEKTKNLKVGNGLDDGIDIGAIVSRQALDAALYYIDEAVTKGARLLCGGGRWGNRGNFLEPTVIADVPDNALCSREEIFAPVAAIYPFSTEEEAIKKANDTEFGLAAYAYTSNVNRVLRLAEKLEAGSIGINDAVPTTSNCPFGGFKMSGWGRELGSEGLDSFLETKHISVGLG